MTWKTFIASLFATFSPLVAEWLRKWLEGKLATAGESIAAPSAFGDTARGTAALFDSAINNTPRLAFARRSLLRRLKAVAVARAGDFASQPVVALTQTEVDDIRDAAGAAENE